MSLQGSLETFALPDVLKLLASTAKTGELQVITERGAGQIWLEGGAIVGGASAGMPMDATNALFELMRSERGDFQFVADLRTSDGRQSRDVETVIKEATSRLQEWRSIERVVPSPLSKIVLSSQAPADTVTVTAEQWKILVSAASNGTVDRVISSLESTEFEVSKIVKELVEAGLVGVLAPQDLVAFTPEDNELAEITTTAEEQEQPTPSLPSTDPVDNDDLPFNDDNEDEPDEAAMARWAEIRRLAQSAGDEEELTEEEAARAAELLAAEGAVTNEEQPINRGQLLKFLSSVRN